MKKLNILAIAILGIAWQSCKTVEVPTGTSTTNCVETIETRDTVLVPRRDANNKLVYVKEERIKTETRPCNATATTVNGCFHANYSGCQANHCTVSRWGYTETCGHTTIGQCRYYGCIPSSAQMRVLTTPPVRAYPPVGYGWGYRWFRPGIYIGF